MGTSKRSYRYSYYDEPLQSLPRAVVERIVQVSRKVAEGYSSDTNWVTFNWTNKQTKQLLSYAEYNKMRYDRMVEELVPEGITEEQIATWDLSIDDITVRESLQFIPTYNLLVRKARGY